jgi:uncharacterized integral membrane protein
MKAKYIALIIVLVLALIILFQNSQVIKIRLLFWKIEMSQIILVLFTLAVGFVLGFVTAKLAGRRHREGA